MRVVLRLFSTQVLKLCKFHAKGSHALIRINESPARASYRLELKRPSPQARHHTTDCSAVSRVPSIWVYQFALQHGKGNSAQPCNHLLLSPKSHRENWTRNAHHWQNVARTLWVAPCQGCFLPFRRKSSAS